MSQPMQPSWWSRNWKWFVPVGCLTTLLFFAAAVMVIASLVFGVMKSSDAYVLALARAKASPAVIERLGVPIKEGFFAGGNINVNGPSGEAELSIPISGPKGSATIFLEARKSAGQWSFGKLLVEVKGSNERIDLLAEPDAADSN